MRHHHSLAALCLLLSATLALAADETPTGGGTFNTPGYTPATPQARPGATPGAAPGSAQGNTAPTGTRPSQPADATIPGTEPGMLRPDQRPRRVELPPA
ncbi:MAG TPA: hypothetical protein VJ598_01955, partial [Albitalea sp.]|nr:hypothetical protein [Albitalea sp.]